MLNTQRPFHPRNCLSVALTAALSLIVVGCGGGTTGSASNNEGGSPPSGIRGVVLSTPSMATVPPGQTDPGTPLVGATITIHPCLPISTDMPDSCAAIDIAEVARTTSGAGGVYSVAVAPGNYVVVGLPINPTNPFPRFNLDGKLVVVTAEQVTTHNVVYDSGIR